MFFFNTKAAVTVIAGIAVGFTVIFWTEYRMLSLFAAIVTAMGVDVWIRIKSEDCDRPLIHPDAGGHIWFAPIWLVGIVLSILIVLAHFNLI